ncbi:Kazal-type serine protease inhibitor family protein [Hymenobacter cellulosilyticus]|uniref:Kazal-type serine protease inhibitor n=1 Tax=Hymenobacter cellulosilyticus TaxID=2932248 RepID=A0A8T9PXS2_9BACT|nr:Kazal-type serine protease inhibitor [Hymenobacter cellulosilyticus]UOQ70074.1 Kazal-type serine protease inhibitor [Hymenobacter cellulosilyticus]
MKKLAVFALLLFAGTSCSKETAAPAPVTAHSSANAKGDDYQCLDVYDPVCANGVTYSNACYAAKAGVTTYTRGACGGDGAAY